MTKENNEYQRGFQDGINNRSVTITIKMLQKNMDRSLIREITELSEEQILAIQQTMGIKQNGVNKIVEDYQKSKNLNIGKMQ